MFNLTLKAIQDMQQPTVSESLEHEAGWLCNTTLEAWMFNITLQDAQ